LTGKSLQHASKPAGCLDDVEAMNKDDEPTESNSLVRTSGQALAKRSSALVVRGIRDLEATDRAYAEAEFESGVECEGAEKFADAAAHYRNAAELQHAQAQFFLAGMYQEGRGVEQNVQEAQVWFGRIREAAERGESEAQVSFALMFHHGLGVGQDYAEAAKWHRRAAEQGDANAAVSVALDYHNGRGVPEDHEEEERWLLKAAAKGNANACYFLGSSYMGTTRRTVCHHEEDVMKAYMWFKLGATKEDGRKEQGTCEVLCVFLLRQGQLSASQIVEAERLAREWEAAVDKVSRSKS
jgi:TPR repeat protein